MFYKCRQILCCLWCCSSFVAGAQVDTVLQLPEAAITAAAVRTQTVGGYTKSWAKESLQQKGQLHLADWLGQEGGLFIKSYGSGSIATTSIRGGSAAHTAVLWNGLPIQSPMLGQLDFSLFPIAFVDRLELTYGGNSAAWGSGAVGGLVGLSNQIPADSTSSITGRTTVGSFGFFDQQLQLAHRRGALAFHTRLFHRQADNDFPYRLRPDLPEKRQNHAGLKQNALLQSLYWTPGADQELSLHLWAQQSDREIPPTTVQNQSLATQADRFVRSALHWKLIRTHTIWQARLGLFREVIDYRDELIRLRALTGFWTAHAELSGARAWKNGQQLHFGLTHSWMTAQADAYEVSPSQHRTAIFGSYRLSRRRLQGQINLRQEMVDGAVLPPVAGLGLEYELLSWLSLKGKVSRNYRLPTLNDLYWQPGGNPELQAESGWSREAGIQLHPAEGISYRFTAFSRRLRNWILWSRPEGQVFWSPNNITEVWSRGLEQRLQWRLAGPDWRLQVHAGYDYILSTNEIALDNPKLEKGAQLIYVPKHQAFGSLSFDWKNLALNYWHTYTGEVQSQNSGPLAAYQLGFAGVDYQLEGSKWQVQLFFQVHNVWDANYRVIERQVMPGRSFQVGMVIL